MPIHNPNTWMIFVPLLRFMVNFDRLTKFKLQPGKIFSQLLRHCTEMSLITSIAFQHCITESQTGFQRSIEDPIRDEFGIALPKLRNIDCKLFPPDGQRFPVMLSRIFQGETSRIEWKSLYKLPNVHVILWIHKGRLRNIHPVITTVLINSKTSLSKVPAHKFRKQRNIYAGDIFSIRTHRRIAVNLFFFQIRSNLR